MPEVKYGSGTTEYGPGVEVWLTPDEVAVAISAYLVAHGVIVNGPRTMTTYGVYVDPSGFVIDRGKKFDGRGPKHGDDR